MTSTTHPHAAQASDLAAVLDVLERAPHGLFVTHINRLNRDLLVFARDQQLA